MKSTVASIVLVFLGSTASTSAFTIPPPVALQTKQFNNAVASTTRQNMIPDLSQMTTSLVETTTNVLSDGQVMESSYSKVSYYTTLGLYIMSFPGLWSQVKRSTSAKLKRKTYIRLVFSLFSSRGEKLIFIQCWIFFILLWKVMSSYIIE